MLHKRRYASRQQMHENLLSFISYQGNKNTVRLYLYPPIKLAKIEKSDHIKSCQGHGESRSTFTADGNVKWHNHFGKEFGSLFKR